MPTSVTGVIPTAAEFDDLVTQEELTAAIDNLSSELSASSGGTLIGTTVGTVEERFVADEEKTVLILAPSATDPGTASEGDHYFNTTTNSYRTYHSGAWANDDAYLLTNNIAATDGERNIGSVASIADLKKLVPTADKQRNSVYSFYAGASNTTYGPFGGGVFQWNAASTLPDDGGSVIQSNVVTGAGRWIRVERKNLNVTHYGADPTGNIDSSLAFVNSSLANVSLIPSGTYKHEIQTVDNDSFWFIGESMDTTIITSSTNVKMFNISGDGGGLSNLTLEYTTSHTSPHFTTTGSRKNIHHVHVLGFGDRASQGQGCILGSTTEGTREVCYFNNNIIEHCSVDVNMSEFKSSQCFFWPISKQYGLKLNGSFVPNNVISEADFLPPFYQTYDSTGNLAVACLWVTGAVLQPRISQCYVDGNPSYVTGVGILLENGVLQPRIEGGTCNKCSSTAVIFDSVIQPFCSMEFYNNNRLGNGSHDILLRQTYSQAMNSPVIKTTHIQSADVSGTLGAAIKIDSTITTAFDWILEPNIRQPGTGTGYASEIDVSSITDPTTIKMSHALGVRRSSVAYGSVVAAIGATSATITIGPLPLFYIPNANQINIVTTSGDYVFARINNTTNNSIFIQFSTLISATTFSARVVLI